MPVDIHYEADEHLIVGTWTNPVSHKDFAQAFKIAEGAYKETTSIVHTIYDASTLTQMPANSISIYLRDPNSPLRHKMAGLFVVVAANAFIRAIVETAGKVSRNPRVHVATSLEEAREMVKQATGSST